MSDRANGAVYLARSIEESDRSGALLPLSDREHASREALRALELTGERLRSERWSARSRVARCVSGRAAAVATRTEIPGHRRGSSDRTHWPPWLSLGCPDRCAGLRSGAGGARRQAPYRQSSRSRSSASSSGMRSSTLALVTAWLRRRGPTEPRAPWSSRTLMRSVRGRCAHWHGVRRPVHTALGEALAHFVTDWTARAGPLLAQRVRRLLHISARRVSPWVCSRVCACAAWCSVTKRAGTARF